MNFLEKSKEIRNEYIEVGYFFEQCQRLFGLQLVSENKGFGRKITDRSIHRPGLALAGFIELFTFNRVQLFGNTEVRYLNSLTKAKKIKAITKFFSFEIPCVIFTNDTEPDTDFKKIARQKKVSIYKTGHSTTKAVYHLSDFLDDQFATQITIHGALVDVYGVGLLFVGRSGIGKSEVTLDLVERGHRLVADDVILATRKGEGILMGSGTSLMKHFMEIRGLGLLNVEKIFGIRSIRFQKRIEVIVVLEEWDSEIEYTRTGLDSSTTSILDVEVQTVRLPIFPGKNITVISEVIALNYLLKHYGYDPAQDMAGRIKQNIENKRKSKEKRSVIYFEHDFE
ncbi:MAG: HPr kinase/phosphorylase [Ignavibacteria bacterium]|nr:HPr kinase/phosphorylase [Ignavibacteria bacterium]